MSDVTEARVAWLAARRNGIGGSDAAAVLGLSTWKSALELYSEKIGLGDVEWDEPEWMYWGKVLEPVIAERYARLTTRLVENPGTFMLQWSTEYPFMCCTIDRQVLDAVRGAGVLEIKNITARKEKEWISEPPIEYQVQLQHNLIVTGCDWGSFAVLLGGQQFLWCDVDRNERFCKYLIEEERKFWDHVQRRIPPVPGDPADSARAALMRLYPTETGESVALDGALMDVADELERLKEKRKSADAEIKKLENELRAAIGSATIGVLPNGTAFSLKLVQRAGYTVGATEYRQLRRVS